MPRQKLVGEVFEDSRKESLITKFIEQSPAGGVKQTAKKKKKLMVVFSNLVAKTTPVRPDA